nr:immunoglobulin heavy chain junction region [Mus musculus]
CARPLAYW